MNADANYQLRAALANLLNAEEAGSRDLLGAESPIIAEISFAVAEELPHLLDVLEHQDGAVTLRFSAGQMVGVCPSFKYRARRQRRAGSRG